MAWTRIRRSFRNESVVLCHIFLIISSMLLLVVCLEDLFISRSPSSEYHDRPGNSPHSVMRKGFRSSLPPSFSNPSRLSDPGIGTRPRVFQYGLTVILPVSQESLKTLGSNLDLILSAHVSILHEIIVAFPDIITVQAAQEIEDTVLHTSTIPITKYPLTGTKAPLSSILHVLPSVLTSHVLLLDTAALRNIPELILVVLLESVPPDIPIGPRGVLISPYNLSCVQSLERIIPAAYLFPPFLAPTALILGAENGVRSDVDVWAALGDRIAKTSTTGFGGLVIRDPMQYQQRCSKVMNTSEPHIFPSTFIQPFNLQDGLNPRTSTPMRFIILLPERDDLKSLAPLICSLFRRGSLLHILLFSWSHDSFTSHFALDTECHIHFETIHKNSSPATSMQQLTSWLSDKDFDVLLYASGTLSYARVIQAIWEEFRTAERTMVQIPILDLPHCEWMAMLNVDDWQNWHKPKIDLSVITNDRPRSLSRLLDSLASARYFGDSIHMRINLEQTADIQTRRIVAHFKWSSGVIHVHHRIISAGLMPAVVESWYPHDNDTYGVLLEDDIEVSPLFYAWIKIAVLRYRYGVHSSHARYLFGISLYQPRNLELHVGGRFPFDPRLLFAEHHIPDVRTPYLSQIPCSWGAVYFPEHFREFHDYLALRLSELTHKLSEPIVPDIRSNKWARSWKRYFNELVYLRGYVMLYPNYALSLVTNHLEIGEHVKDDRQNMAESVRKQYDVPLMPLRSADLLEAYGETLPPWDDLPILDFWGAVTSHQEILRRGYDRHELLSGCPSRLGQITYEARELLCSRTRPS